MARANTPTLLSLDRFAQILGVPPAHFAGGYTATVFPVTASCSQVWFQHAWQATDKVGREELATAIASAESDIANELGYWPAPVWFEDEVHRYPRHHRRELVTWGYNVRGGYRSIQTNWAKIIVPGRRALGDRHIAKLADLSLQFLNLDGDAYSETARITLPYATLTTNVNEIKVYFSATGGDPVWEIRPARSKTFVGANVVIDFWAWQLIQPALWEAFPIAGGPQALDLMTAIYVDEVDVYHEYTDTTQVSAQFFWEPKPHVHSYVCPACGGTGCVACTLTVQDGCSHIRDVHQGFLVPVPATYDEATGQWNEQTRTECREPDHVKLWYYAGDQSNLFLSGRSYDPLSQRLAEAIAWLTIARLERQLCECSNVTALSQRLQVDLAESPEEGSDYMTTEDQLNNPFGTRRGELKAWRRISKLTEQRGEVAVI